MSLTIPTDIVQAMRGRFAYYDFPTLEAASFEIDSKNKHLRIDFFFSGQSPELDFEELEGGLLNELIADAWAGFDTVGFATIFDPHLTERALSNPQRLYPP